MPENNVSRSRRNVRSLKKKIKILEKRKTIPAVRRKVRMLKKQDRLGVAVIYEMIFNKVNED